MLQQDPIKQKMQLIGRHLTFLREGKRLSIGTVAAITGINEARLQKIEEGIADPLFSEMEALALGYGCHFHELFPEDV
ncbi:MAG: hypothetical protein BGO55_08560 [Sphingobacteriales bacterium 50-39]|nr:helix-turn-helix transcriptional regulator [Sphingobacteriales bacterium]OJW59315.1 MAG: hypothetical protein BGO55_08560 [Sphingobacteriales bacterium 50-39]